MTLTLLVTFLLSKQISPIFTTNMVVIGSITIVLGMDPHLIDGTQLFASWQLLYKLGGDTKIRCIMTAIGIWAIGTVGVYILGVYYGFGLVGVWIAIAIDNYIRAIFLISRYRSFKWLRNLT